jgi:hypothetical protein
MPVDCSHHRQRAGEYRLEHLTQQQRQVPGVVRAALRIPLEIEPGAEHMPLAGDDHRPDIAAGELPELQRDGLQQLAVHQV